MTARPLTRATASVTILDREEIEALNVTSVAELMRFVPGLTLSTGGPRGGFATAQIRGGDPNFTMVLVDGVARLLPGALGAEGAAESDSHASGLLEGPHYTRPETFREWSVPQILRSGHEAKIERWRRQQALRRTWQRRPDLLLTAEMSEEDRYFLMELAAEDAESP